MECAHERVPLPGSPILHASYSSNPQDCGAKAAPDQVPTTSKGSLATRPLGTVCRGLAVGSTLGMATARFSVDARALLTLGRDSIKDPVTAVLELVKNSYDADARCVEIELASRASKTKLRVADNGVGMAPEVVKGQWLRIGFSEKRSKTKTRLSRRATGEKGIGRLSADRLGSMLELRTQAANTTAVALKVNWSSFEQDGVNIEQVQLPYIDPPTVPVIPEHKASKGTGTELIISELRQSWSRTDVAHLQQELSILRPPISTGDEFEIRFTNDVDEALNGTIDSSFEGQAEVRLVAELQTDGSVEFWTNTRNARGAVVEGEPQSETWVEFTSAETLSKKELLGPIRVTLDFFPRKAEVLRGTALKLQDLRSFLDQHVGIRIYRDGIRVRPYGGDGDDWLGLATRKVKNPAGAGRTSFRISPNQLVGAVAIGRDKNPRLVDSSAREGLVHNNAFEHMRVLVLGCVRKIEQEYHRQVQKRKEADRPGALPGRTLRAELRDATVAIKKLSDDVARGKAEDVQRGLNDLPVLLKQLEAATEAVEENASQTTVLRGLATVGIASAVFGHETQSSLELVHMSATLAKRLLGKEPPKLNDAIVELAKTITHTERVSAWGEFALARLKRDKRRRKSEDIERLLDRLLDALDPAMTASGITVGRQLGAVTGRTFAMDVEAIAINLLTNAYTACQLGSDNRRIKVDLRAKQRDKRDGFELVVADSGPGVPDRIRDMIWAPLFTTSPREGNRFGGTGLGLSIVQSIVNEHEGHHEVDRDPRLKGARFTIWLPLG